MKRKYAFVLHEDLNDEAGLSDLYFLRVATVFLLHRPPMTSLAIFHNNASDPDSRFQINFNQASMKLNQIYMVSL